MRPLITVTPAVTTTVQSTFVTGGLPREPRHRRQRLVLPRSGRSLVVAAIQSPGAGRKAVGTARRRDPAFTCAKLFWWYNMYSSADIAVTPRPDVSRRMDASSPTSTPIRPSCATSCRDALGQFPLFRFWGPAADIVSSRGSARARCTCSSRSRPTLTLVYLPHLDYNLQRLGPRPSGHRAATSRRWIEMCGELIDAAAARRRARHGVVRVRHHPVSNPVHINRALRQAGWHRACAKSWAASCWTPVPREAFAVADHQIAHIYVARPDADRMRANRCVEALPGVERVLDEAGKREIGLDHPRSGELVAIAARGQLVHLLLLSR